MSTHISSGTLKVKQIDLIKALHDRLLILEDFTLDSKLDKSESAEGRLSAELAAKLRARNSAATNDPNDTPPTITIEDPAKIKKEKERLHEYSDSVNYTWTSGQYSNHQDMTIMNDFIRTNQKLQNNSAINMSNITQLDEYFQRLVSKPDYYDHEDVDFTTNDECQTILMKMNRETVIRTGAIYSQKVLNQTASQKKLVETQPESYPADFTPKRPPEQPTNRPPSLRRQPAPPSRQIGASPLRSSQIASPRAPSRPPRIKPPSNPKQSAFTPSPRIPPPRRPCNDTQTTSAPQYSPVHGATRYQRRHSSYTQAPPPERHYERSYSVISSPSRSSAPNNARSNLPPPPSHRPRHIRARSQILPQQRGSQSQFGMPTLQEHAASYNRSTLQSYQQQTVGSASDPQDAPNKMPYIASRYGKSGVKQVMPPKRIVLKPPPPRR